MSTRQLESHEVFTEEVTAFALAVRDLRRARWTVLFADDVLGPGAAPLDSGEIDTLDQIALADGARMFELAEALQIEASTATRAVDRLIRRGLVDRGRDPSDGRYTQVWLTDDGRRVHSVLVERRLDIVQAILERLDEDDRAPIVALLPKLAAAVADTLADSEGTRR